MIVCLVYCGVCIVRLLCRLFIFYKLCKYICEVFVLNLLYLFKVYYFDIFVGIELNEILLFLIICLVVEK